MRALMEDDAERFRKALEKTGNKVGSVEVVMAMTLRYEADVDLPTLAAEAGVRPEELLIALTQSEVLTQKLRRAQGARRSTGGPASRGRKASAIWCANCVWAARFSPARWAKRCWTTPARSIRWKRRAAPPTRWHSAAMAVSPPLPAPTRRVRIVDVEANRDLRRCIGHTASVWSVAFSPDGTRMLSGSKDGSVRLWDVETGRELRRLDGHDDLVTASPSRPMAGMPCRPASRTRSSSGIWTRARRSATSPSTARRSTSTPSPSRPWADVPWRVPGTKSMCSMRETGKVVRTLSGHSNSVVCAVFSPDGTHILCGSDDPHPAALGRGHRQGNPRLSRP